MCAGWAAAADSACTGAPRRAAASAAGGRCSTCEYPSLTADLALPRSATCEAAGTTAHQLQLNSVHTLTPSAEGLALQ